MVLGSRSMSQELLPAVAKERWLGTMAHIVWKSTGLTGEVYTDGACRKFWFWPEAARAGWVFCQLRERISDTLVYGALPGPVQFSPRSERFAFLQVLHVALPPLHVHTDYNELVKGLARGPEWWCAPRRPNMNLWTSIWSKVEDFGRLGEHFQVRHVRGHQRGQDNDFRGNRLADLGALAFIPLHCRQTSQSW